MSFAVLARESETAAPKAKTKSALRTGNAGDAFEREADRDTTLAQGEFARPQWSLSRMTIEFPGTIIQKKLTINKPGDEYEQQADRISEQVMQMSEPRVQRECMCGGTCSKCQAGEKHDQIQTKRARGVSQEQNQQQKAPRIVSDVLASPGRPLDSATRAFMEPRFGVDFSSVRIHSDTTAGRSASQIGALAYTAGRNVVFGEGQYQPNTPGGQRLLAHELTHVVQQSIDSQSPSVIQRVPDGDGQDGPETASPDPFEKNLDSWRQQASEFNEKAPFAARMVLLLENTGSKDDVVATLEDFDTLEEFDNYLEDESHAAGDEDGEEYFLQNNLPSALDESTALKKYPKAFPFTWAKRLEFQLKPIGFRSQTEPARAKMDQSGGRVVNNIFDQGLPVDYLGSLGLRTFELTPTLLLPFVWIALPSGTVDTEPLANLTNDALNYLSALEDEDFNNQLQVQVELIKVRIEQGNLSVDPEAYDRLLNKKDWLQVSPPAGIPADLSGEIGPVEADTFAKQLAGTLAFGMSLTRRRKEAADLANQYIERVDFLVANDSGPERVVRATRWSYHKFDLEALEQEAQDLESHAVDTVVDTAVDVAEFAVLSLIPYGKAIAKLVTYYRLAKDAYETLNELKSAAQEAWDAKSAVELQRAAAHQAHAISSTARKVATFALTHAAFKVGEYAAGKVRGSATTADDVTRGPDRDPDAQGGGRDRANIGKPAATRPDSDSAGNGATGGPDQAAASKTDKTQSGTPDERVPRDGESNKPPADYIRDIKAKDNIDDDDGAVEGPREPHDVVASDDGVGLCSNPCPNIGLLFKEELDANPKLKKRNADLQTTALTDPAEAVKLGKALIQELRRIRRQNIAIQSVPAAVDIGGRAPDLKDAAGKIHGTDQHRIGQTLLTAELELPSGKRIRVAIPNSPEKGAAWRPEQKADATRRGFTPLDPSTPRSGLHAEDNLKSYLDATKARVVRWAISRGRGGTSEVCEGCKTWRREWGPPVGGYD